MDVGWDDEPCGVVATLIDVLERGRLPHLDSLGLTTHVPDHDLASCLRAMSRVSGLSYNSTQFGPQAFEVLETHFGTLWTLQLKECFEVSESMIETVLESCPSLEELVYGLMSARPVQDGRLWVCLGLKKLNLEFYLERRAGVSAQSRAIFGRLGRLTRLESLVIGSDAPDHFQGLEFRLQSGLNQLDGFRRLATVDFGNAVQENLGIEDVEWMRTHLKGLSAVLGKCNTPVGLDEQTAQFWKMVRSCNNTNHTM
ncbi:hypothetical protein MVEG_10380 [Podila verticillata NRRL 6337]|nr:hypothetical protein MVEG_10380 [Podila verticillata NRRL 6337]